MEPILPYALSFAAGAMIYVVAEELIPESRANKHSGYPDDRRYGRFCGHDHPSMWPLAEMWLTVNAVGCIPCNKAVL